MVENRPILTILTHLVLIFGVMVVMLPVWMALVASTHAPEDLPESPTCGNIADRALFTSFSLASTPNCAACKS